MYCKYCGTKISDTACFCRECGKMVKGGNSAVQNWNDPNNVNQILSNQARKNPEEGINSDIITKVGDKVTDVVFDIKTTRVSPEQMTELLKKYFINYFVECRNLGDIQETRKVVKGTFLGRYLTRGDGKYQLFVSGINGARTVWIRNLETKENWQLKIGMIRSAYPRFRKLALAMIDDTIKNFY